MQSDCKASSARLISPADKAGARVSLILRQATVDLQRFLKDISPPDMIIGPHPAFASKYTTANVKNHGVAGASARSYYRDVWPTTLQVINSGDVVVLEFGHYDNKMPGSVADVAAGCVGSVPGAGSQTMTVTGCDGSQEVVRTFGVS